MRMPFEQAGLPRFAHQIGGWNAWVVEVILKFVAALYFTDGRGCFKEIFRRLRHFFEKISFNQVACSLKSSAFTMIISRTPYRISFFGGGTDYPAWYRSFGGAVLATAIDKYCYLTCRFLPPFFEHRTRVVYSKIETVQCTDDIAHPAVREVVKYLNVA